MLFRDTFVCVCVRKVLRKVPFRIVVVSGEIQGYN